VDDHATINIYYEGRLAKLGHDPKKLPQIDEQVDAVVLLPVDARERLRPFDVAGLRRSFG
jgi:hypothetical protein